MNLVTMERNAMSVEYAERLRKYNRLHKACLGRLSLPIQPPQRVLSLSIIWEPRAARRWQNVKRDTFSKSHQAKTHFSNEKRPCLALQRHGKAFVFLPHRARMEREESDVTQTARVQKLPAPIFPADVKFSRPRNCFCALIIAGCVHTCAARWQLSLGRALGFGRRLSKHSARERCLREYQVSASFNRRRYHRVSVYICVHWVSAASDLDRDFGADL